MNRILIKILGACILAVSALLLILLTGSINAAIDMGGPMNLSPSSIEWAFIVLIADVILLLLACSGIKLLGLKKRPIGLIVIAIGVIILLLGIKNHVEAPPFDGINNTEKMPVPFVVNLLVYGLVMFCLGGGTWLVTNGSEEGR